MASSKSDSQPVHGLLADNSWALPRKVVDCASLARPGYESVSAHEYEEQPEVFQAKIELLADLIRQSKSMIAYTGAGISTASGISDYASRSAGDKSSVKVVKKKGSFIDYEPSFGHRALVALYFAGHLKWWCQQNHDGLPQKAGLPQKVINEIHGSWWDPTNPVVKMSSNLRDDLLADLVRWEHKADLVLTVGTSLSGMNADRLVETVSRKKIKQMAVAQQVSGKVELPAEDSDDEAENKNDLDTPVLGSVIIGIQRTRLDKFCSLRIFAKIDRVFEALCKQLDLNSMMMNDDDGNNSGDNRSKDEKDEKIASVDEVTNMLPSAVSKPSPSKSSTSASGAKPSSLSPGTESFSASSSSSSASKKSHQPSTRPGSVLSSAGQMVASSATSASKPVSKSSASSSNKASSAASILNAFERGSATVKQLAGLSRANPRKIDYKPLKSGQIFPCGRIGEEHVFEFTNYDSKTGFLKAASSSSSLSAAAAAGKPLILDLREGARIKITYGPHAGKEGRVDSSRKGHYRMSVKTGADKVWHCVLGGWMLDDALNGTAARVPVINC